MSNNGVINTYALQHNPIESSKIGVLGSVAAVLQNEGTYLGTVLRNGSEVGSFRINVGKDLPETQADVDMAVMAKDAVPEVKEGCCPDDKSDAAQAANRETVYNVAQGGYMVLHASQGQGNFQAVVDFVPHDGGERVDFFNSDELRRGNIFIATLLRPGQYQLMEHVQGSQGTVHVAYPPEPSGDYVAPEPLEVQVNGGGELGNFNLQPTQSMVFYIMQARASLSLNLMNPTPSLAAPIRWTNPVEGLD